MGELRGLNRRSSVMIFAALLVTCAVILTYSSTRTTDVKVMFKSSSMQIVKPRVVKRVLQQTTSRTITSKTTTRTIPTSTTSTTTSASTTTTSTSKPSTPTVFDISKEAELTPQQLLDINVNVTSPGTYRDYGYAKKCHIKCPRSAIFKTMKWFMAFAAKHNITWFATYGTLVGAWRHKDCIPWEHDMDVGILQRDEARVRKLQTPRGKVKSSQGNLVCRPGPFCLYYGASNRRQTCSGRHVSKSQDTCSFCGPLARVFYSSAPFMDLFIYKYEKKKDGNLQIYDEGNYDHSGGKKKYTDPKLLFPLKKCTFMGLTLLCPQKEKEYISWVYGTSRPPKLCEKNRWVGP